MSDMDEILDGYALWQEHRPQTGEDWLKVARRFIADDGDTTDSSPLFAGLVLAVERLAVYERAAAADDVAEWNRLRNDARLARLEEPS